MSPTEAPAVAAAAAAGPQPTAGSRVRVANLQSAQELNGAIGVVVGAPDEATGRLPVVLLGPAGRARPQGIKAKPANLDLLPAQRCVKLFGLQTQQMQLNAEQQLELAGCHAGRLTWKDCPVPSLLGVPLALKRLAPHLPRPNFEQPAVLLLMDPLTGFAPMDVQFSGLGEVLLARTDGACQMQFSSALWQNSSSVQRCGRTAVQFSAVAEQ